MKRILVFLSVICIAFQSRAAVGDTTWVQAHTDIWMPNFGNYDTVVHEFPDGSKSYRKIFMEFTLGKYQCPGTPQYCGDWDYTVQTFIMTKNGDSLELGRLITPYANSINPRTPITWKERYTFDVTDLYNILKDSGLVRIHYSGYSGGFTANVRFAFIEGTPARNVLGISRTWHGYFAFGKVSDPIENHVGELSMTAPAGTASAAFKFNITGHGSDNNGCGEFCKKYYQVKFNGGQIAQTDIWRDNCGLNSLYPQTGTWPYDRANWCPGALVETKIHNLTDASALNAGYKLDVDFEPYTDNGKGGYEIDGMVVYYGAMNKNTDADLAEVISPNAHEKYFRANVNDNKPVIRVANSGATDITSMKIQYYAGSSAPNEYNWTGIIKPNEDAIITLPEDWKLRMATGSNSFTAQIMEVNGKADDDDKSNNTYKSYFAAIPQWPMTLIVEMRTNKGALNGAADNSWKIQDALGNVIAQRNNCNIQSLYTDTVKLGPGSYTVTVNDLNCDGMDFWYNRPTVGSGSFSVRSTQSLIPFALGGYFKGDFGCGFTQAFNVVWAADVPQVNISNAGMRLYPNPATEMVHIAFAGMTQVNGVVTITDAIGRVVLQQNCTSYNVQMNTTTLSNGVYNATYTSSDASLKLQTKLVISK